MNFITQLIFLFAILQCAFGLLSTFGFRRSKSNSKSKNVFTKDIGSFPKLELTEILPSEMEVNNRRKTEQNMLKYSYVSNVDYFHMQILSQCLS